MLDYSSKILQTLYVPFGARGGLGKMHPLFGERLDAIIEELNEGLTA